MKETGWMRKAQRPLPTAEAASTVPVTRCTVEGCQNLAFGAERCDSCEGQIEALRKMSEQSSPDYTNAAGPASRLEDSAWAAAAFTVFFYLIWSTRSWWIEWFEMWLHSGN